MRTLSFMALVLVGCDFNGIRDPASPAGDDGCVPETCNGQDDDCDGEIDEEVGEAALLTWYADDDADGYGDPGETTSGCEAPGGFIADDSDCDDTNAMYNPSVEEDGGNDVDENCDGVIDETCGSHAPVLSELEATFDPAYDFGGQEEPGMLIHFEMADEDADLYQIKIRAWMDKEVDGAVDTSGDPNSTFNTITLDEGEECDYPDSGMTLSFSAKNLVDDYTSVEWAIEVADAQSHWSEPAIVVAPLQ
ncbi:hypothetical protein LBMAG42_50550 [Deltaproteobacteria bacterium]|nr:hypothetical protein LBMAG42_50550 [Deltaproteobacteria bacterium]